MKNRAVVIPLNQKKDWYIAYIKKLVKFFNYKSKVQQGHILDLEIALGLYGQHTDCIEESQSVNYCHCGWIETRSKLVPAYKLEIWETKSAG